MIPAPGYWRQCTEQEEMIELLQACDSLTKPFLHFLFDKATPTHFPYAILVTVTCNAMPYLSTDLSLQIPSTFLQ